MNAKIPILHVEGPDDVFVVGGLLSRHGVDTKKGTQHLQIKSRGGDDRVLSFITEAIAAATDREVGFVIDIDTELHSRWDAVCQRVRAAGVQPPRKCPDTGYIDRVPDYPYKFGIWLMPDCNSDHCKIEHLTQTLIPSGDLLLAHARSATTAAAAIIDTSNAAIENIDLQHKRFRDVDKVKSEIYAWLAWQPRPGIPLGGAISAEILRHDSPEAIAFLKWLSDLYSFTYS